MPCFPPARSASSAGSSVRELAVGALDYDRRMPDSEAVARWMRQNEAAREADRQAAADRSMSSRLAEAVRLSRLAAELEDNLRRAPDVRPDELIAALADAGIEYVLIGGLAVGAHGFPRATKDLDIVPNPDAANLKRLATLLRRTRCAASRARRLRTVGVSLRPARSFSARRGRQFRLDDASRTPRHHAMGPGHPRRARLRSPQERDRRHHPQRSPRACLLTRRSDRDEASRRSPAGPRGSPGARRVIRGA